jgi:hypothetical protein
MIAALAVALLLAPQARSTEILRHPPTVAVDVQRDTVTISVQPPATLKVRRVIMENSRSWTAPIKSEPLVKNGVRATFRHPQAPYAFFVTLDDGTQYRVTVTVSGRITVQPQETPGLHTRPTEPS